MFKDEKNKKDKKKNKWSQITSALMGLFGAIILLHDAIPIEFIVMAVAAIILIWYTIKTRKDEDMTWEQTLGEYQTKHEFDEINGDKIDRLLKEHLDMTEMTNQTLK